MNKDNATVEGGCLCGKIRYESSRDPFRTGFCHCRMCQKNVGNVFATAAFFRHEDFRFIKDQPKWFQSSGNVQRGFCPECGSPVAYQHASTRHIAIWMGTLDTPELFPPQVHWYSDAKIPWVDICPDLEDATDALESVSGAPDPNRD